jgi:hypothetical protein
VRRKRQQFSITGPLCSPPQSKLNKVIQRHTKALRKHCLSKKTKKTKKQKKTKKLFYKGIQSITKLNKGIQSITKDKQKAYKVLQS